MQADVRTRNRYFQSKEIGQYLKEYAQELSTALSKVDGQHLEMAKDLLRLTLARNGRIFVGGNGGSAAISDHLTCDFIKGTYTETHNPLQVHSLVGSQALFSAIGNDLGYEYTLAFQLRAAMLTSKDTLILISSSGNSPNIVKAASFANERRATVIGMTGFSGGELYKMAHIKLHIPVNNYGVVEDCHQALMHVLSQFHFLSTQPDEQR